MPHRPTPPHSGRLATRGALAAIWVGALLCAGCAGPAAPPRDAPVATVLQFHGRAETHQAQGPREVVIIRDRHPTGPGITYVDDELRALQREHHELVTDLVAREFRLLGCEFNLGPLPTDGAAADHLDRLAWAEEQGDDPNRWSVYQPLRYQREFAGRLEVLGVEDPELYQADLAALDRLDDVVRLRRRTDWTSGPTDDELRRNEAQILVSIRLNVQKRGAAAARNLVRLMDERHAPRAILMLGAAHVPSASRTLSELNVRHHVFTAPGFERRDPAPRP